MSQHTPEAITIAIAQARSFRENERFLERHLPLVHAIGSYGVETVALNGAKYRVVGNSFSTYWSFDDLGLEQHDQDVQITSALDLSGGIARYMPDVAVLNSLGVREIVSSKQSQYDVLKSLGDRVAQTVTATANRASVTDALDHFQSKKLILKAELDIHKKYGMLIGSHDDILAGLDAVLAPMNPQKDRVVIQEYMDEVHAPFADGLEYASSEEKDAVTPLQHLDREIRVHTIDSRPILVTGRAGLDAAHKSPLDDWIYLKQDTIPAHITDLASQAAQLIMARAQATSAYLAVDLTPDGSRIGEVNGRNIGTMYVQEGRPGSVEAQTITTNELAKKLVSMAHNNQKEQ